MASRTAPHYSASCSGRGAERPGRAPLRPPPLHPPPGGPDRDTRAGAGVVITGGSSGLGLAMAAEFLAQGDAVLVTGRDRARLYAAWRHLESGLPPEEAGKRVFGFVGDVTVPEDVERLAEEATARLGRVDTWVNNAGRASCQKRPLWELSAADVGETAATNMAGTLLGCRKAVQLMKDQPHGAGETYRIFNLGFSASGSRLSQSTVPHKSTKRGARPRRRRGASRRTPCVSPTPGAAPRGRAPPTTTHARDRPPAPAGVAEVTAFLALELKENGIDRECGAPLA